MSNLKLSTLLSGAIASSLLLTACGGGSSSSESTPQPTPTVPANPVQTALLSGTVISKASSTPIAGATISVDQLSVTTDKDGKYTLSNLPTGNKNITVIPNYPARMWMDGHYDPRRIQQNYQKNITY